MTANYLSRACASAFLAAMPFISAQTTEGVPQTLVFEPEDWTEPKDAWQKDKLSEDKWNLWSTDSHAMQKWSKGIVLQSPVVKEDRATPEDGAPPLHTRITGIPLGTYEVSVKLGRTLAVSRDGKTWEPKNSADTYIGKVEITDGTFELWVDDRYADPRNIGPCYYDTLIFSPLWPKQDKPPVKGYAAKRVREPLGRAVVALRRDATTVYVGWRLLKADAPGSMFNVYRTVNGKTTALNDQPIRETTDFVDRNAPAGLACQYTVRLVTPAGEGPASQPAKVASGTDPVDCLTFPVPEKETFQKVGIGDLDGDGRYDYVIKSPHDNIDPGSTWWTPSPNTYKLTAINHAGQQLWRHDLGWSIERGIWYSPYIVFDLDGDGKAEVAAKTGEGDPRGEDGRVEKGPEYVTIWDGATGKELAKAPWLSRKAPGDVYNYNLSSRNQICVAYLDGKTPCLIVARGTYTVIRLVAYEFHKGTLRKLWEYDNREDGRLYRAQGAHIMHAADVDDDGRDEVIIGSAVIDDNGVGLWSTGYGHPDYCFVGDIDPSRPGLEIFYGVEPPRKNHALCLVEAKTGKVIWGLEEATNHVGTSGMCADIDPRHPGLECYAADIDRERKYAQGWYYSATGEILAKGRIGSVSSNAYWDADPQREVIQGPRIRDFQGAIHPPTVSGRFITVADVLGDWREEIIMSVAGELRIYSTTIAATDRRACLMQDPIYRIDVAVAAMGYWGSPMLSTCISAETASLAFIDLPPVLEPGKTTEGKLVVQAAVGQPLRGRVSLGASGRANAFTERDPIRVPAGGLIEVPFTVSVPRASGIQENREQVTLYASLQAAGKTLRTSAKLFVADVPVPGPPSCEAETIKGQGGGKVQIRTDKAGASGKAISHWDSKGHWLAWQAKVPRTGTYRLALRYCTPDGAARDLQIDGKDAGSVSFVSTGGFGGATNDWGHALLRDAKGKPLEWQLTAGPHAIRMTNTDGLGLNLDYLQLIPVE